MNFSQQVLGHIAQKMLGQTWVHNNAEKAQQKFKEHPDIFTRVFGLDSYRDFLENSRSFSHDIKILGKSTVILPSLFMGYNLFEGFPDLDISTLGIGQHRYWLLHSGLAAYAIKRLRDIANSHLGDSLPEKVASKALDAFAGGACLGLGLHLMSDFLTPKSVVFPFVGSLVDGTMVDDSVWLLGNSIYCFYVASDIFALGIGKDLDELKNFIWREFGVFKLEQGRKDLKNMGLDGMTSAHGEVDGAMGAGRKSTLKCKKSSVLTKDEEEKHLPIALFPWGEDPDELAFNSTGGLYE